MLVHENELWPTWTSVPAPNHHAEKVKASFRIFGVPSTGCSGFSGGAGGPPPITWSFYTLLARFLSHGPVGLLEDEAERGISISVLELDFCKSSGPIAPQAAIEGYGYGYRGGSNLSKLRDESGIGYMMPANYLADYVKMYIQQLLGMSPATAPFGGLLYERIGKIRILLDSDLRHEWDIAEEFTKVKFGDFRHWVDGTQVTFHFRKWQKKARKTRVKLGLPVIEAEEDKVVG